MRILLLSLGFAFAIGPAGLAAQEPAVIERCYLGAINDVALAADEVGKLIKVFVEDGASVTGGEVIAQIDDNDAVMAREVAQYKYAAAAKQATNDVSVKAAIAANGVAKASLEKILQANAKQPGAYTETEVLRAELDEERSRLQIDLAKHEMDVARAEAWASNAQLKQSDAMIERRKLKAPFGGVVNQVIREAGEWVNAGDPVVHLVQMDRLRVHGRMDADIFSWQDVLSRPVEVTVYLPGGGTHVINGQIGFASQVVDDDGAFRIWAEIENTPTNSGWLMGPGLPASMSLR